MPAIHIPEFVSPINYTMVFPRHTAAWNKPSIFTLDNLYRIVVLDADSLALRNKDELVDIIIPEDTISACHAIPDKYRIFRCLGM